MQRATIFILLIVWLIMPASVLAAYHTETFTDFSGYDPFQSNAKCNPHHQRLEIHPIHSASVVFPTAVTLDQSGGYYLLYVQGNGLYTTACFQHFSADGDPLLPDGGVPIFTGTLIYIIDAVTLTGGDVMVVWIDYENTAVFTQRFNSNGLPVWGAPSKINNTPAGVDIRSAAIAALPGNEAVVVFSDERTGESRGYIQRINGNGDTLWSSEKRLQTVVDLNEYYIDVVTDSAGTIFAGWNQQDTTMDVAFTKVALDGTVAWDPAVVVNRDTSCEHRTPTFSIREGDGIYFSWISSDGLSYFVDMQKMNYNGTCDYATDHTIITHENNFNNVQCSVLASGNLMLSFSFMMDYRHLLATVVLDPAFTPFAIPSQLFEPTSLKAVQTVCSVPGSAGGAMFFWGASSDFLMSLESMLVGNLGQPIWPAPRHNEVQSGGIVRTWPQFTKNSGGDGGYHISWIDNRNHSFHGVGCRFESPIQANMVPRELDFDEKMLAIKSSRAEDGSISAAWIKRLEDGYDIEIMWYDASWNPQWKEPVLVASLDLVSSLSGMDFDVDSLGRAVVTWSLSGGTDPGTYMQVVTSNRERVHPVPVKVDTGVLTGYFHGISISPLNDGSVLIAWIDDSAGDDSIWVQRVRFNGTLDWPAPMNIVIPAAVYLYDPTLVRANGLNTLIFSMYDGTTETIYRAIFDDNGTLAEIPQPISAAYDYCTDPAAAVINNDIYVVWGALQSGLLQVYGQKLINGNPAWIDKVFSGTAYDSIRFLDLIPTGTNTLVYACMTSQMPTDYLLVQAFDTNGNTAYSSERQMFMTDPLVYSMEYGISSRVNTGENVNWAAITVTDELRGGQLVYWLSNDGGTTWNPAEPGLPVVFSSTGNDLRWGVDLYADYYLEHSPYVTSITTYWNEGTVASELVMNHEHYYGGDTFRLIMRHTNSGSAVLVDKYILLDVYGMYWYWPSWSESVDFNQDSISSGYTEDVIFDFTWPSNVGEAHDLRFWSALLEPGTANLVGPWDYVTFGYGP